MFLPIGDEPNPHHFPAMTVTLIAVNVAVFVLVTLPLSMQSPNPGNPVLAEYVRMILPLLPPGTSAREALQYVTAYDLVVFEWGFRVASPGLLTLLTSLFLHGSFMHLAGNMLYLWIYGDNVEHRLGALPFLFWYLVAGVAATLFHALFSAGSPVPLVGASGAISGVLGFYLIWFPRHVVKIFVFLFPIYVGIVHVNATIVLILYLVMDNLLPFLMAPTVGGIAHGAHIGGFLAGMAVALVLRARR
jgi:membrane associated rhomboid family serine protease